MGWIRRHRDTLLMVLVVIGIVLDLTISGVLAYQVRTTQHATAQLRHNTEAARCWDRVLDHAVLVPQTPTERRTLQGEAIRCARLIP